MLNKKALNTESQNQSSISSLAQWQNKINEVYKLIDEATEGQLLCIIQECKEEGRSNLAAKAELKLDEIRGIA